MAGSSTRRPASAVAVQPERARADAVARARGPPHPHRARLGEADRDHEDEGVALGGHRVGRQRVHPDEAHHERGHEVHAHLGELDDRDGSADPDDLGHHRPLDAPEAAQEMVAPELAVPQHVSPGARGT